MNLRNNTRRVAHRSRRARTRRPPAARRQGPRHPNATRLPVNRGIPSFNQLQCHFIDEQAAIDFLVSEGIFTIPTCDRCGLAMIPDDVRGTRRYHCRKHTGERKSITGDTFFRHSHVPIHSLLILLYCFILGMNHTSILQFTGLSRETVTQKLREARQLLATVVEFSTEEYRIGGPGRVIQIDESKFGKIKRTKGKRGHPIEGGWVFGGCELSTDEWEMNDYFAVCVADRTSETLLPIIR